MSDLTEQRLDQIRAIAARATERPLMVSDCEGELQVWAESALTHVTRDNDGAITGYSTPSTYRSTDQVIEMDLDSWDPGEDATDDQRRQDIHDLVDARDALSSLLTETDRLAEQVNRVRAFAVSHEYRWLLELLDGYGTHGGAL